MQLNDTEQYSRDELKFLWLRFKDNKMAVEMLMDFSGYNRLTALKLISEFNDEETEPYIVIIPKPAYTDDW